MRTRVSSIYQLVKGIIDNSTIKDTLGIQQVLIGSQRFQPANDNDDRKMSDYVPAVIITDSPGMESLGPFHQASAEIKITLRVYYLSLIEKGENPIIDCSDETDQIMDIFAGYEQNLNNINGMKIYSMLPGPNFKPYDSDFSAAWREAGIPIMVGWFDLSIHGVADRASSVGPDIPLVSGVRWRLRETEDGNMQMQHQNENGNWEMVYEWTP